jgi:hypothetical protein
MPEKELSEHHIKLLKSVVDHFDDEDRSVRDRQIRQWRRLKLFWDGFSRVYYDETAHDWRVWDSQANEGSDQDYYDKPVNVFRAYLESIIAALSITVPAVKCYPDDAEETLDVDTAKAGDKISQLIYRHNDVALLWIHALFIYCTEGMVACYTYPKEDESYGTYKKREYKDVEEPYLNVTCPTCGTETEQESDEFMPTGCPECGNEVSVETKTRFVNRLVGETTHAKSRICQEVYGGLYVKVPNYAKAQADCPYLIFSYETHYANARECYPEIRDKIQPSFGTGYEAYERWGRLSTQYRGEYPINNVTCRYAWLRPAAFEILDEDDCEELKKLFPSGAKVTLVNDIFARAENEKLDDVWTLTHNPLSDYIHFDPLGLLLTSLQEITNDLVSLILQTIEHGIPQTFADSTVLDFNAYKQQEVAPGMINPAKAKTGRALGDGFYEVRTATLSGEVMPFAREVQNLAQVVSGALPSLFGGQLDGSKTASEYSMSRSQALQRLQNTWKMFGVWWKTIFGKVIPMYIKEIKERETDERFVEKDNFGGFINVFIRRVELEGKLGRVELEANENLPITWNQMRDTLLRLMEMNNPQFMQAMTVPENLPIMREAIGLTDFYIPGEEDRDKQNDEIKQLLNGEPIIQQPDEMQMLEAQMAGDPNLAQPIEEPSVEIDPMFDNHAIHFELCRKWIIGNAGRLAKVENPAGYQNVLLHAQQHQMILQQQMMEQRLAEMESASPAAKPEEGKEAPIQGEEDVRVQV